MYMCVAWEAYTDDAALTTEIGHAVDVACGTLQRARLMRNVILIRPRRTDDISVLIAQLDTVEAVYRSLFGYTLLFHADGERFRCSDPFDESAAQSVTKATPI